MTATATATAGRRNTRFPVLTLLAAATASAPAPAMACATCFGQSDDPMAKGMNMGIFSLLVVVTVVLAGFAAFGVFLVRRAAQFAAQADSAAAVASSGPEAVSPATSNVPLSALLAHASQSRSSQ